MQWNTYGEIEQLVAVFFLIEYFLTWLDKGLACVLIKIRSTNLDLFAFIYMYNFSNVSEKR